MAQKIAVVIRGHERNVFDTNELCEFVKMLVGKYNIDIYIHTWNKSVSPYSWRPMSEYKLYDINESIVNQYFSDISNKIKCLIVDDDSNLELHGSLDGRVAGGPCPKIAWKRMWYGKFKIINEVANSEQKYKFIMNMRFDILKFEKPDRILYLLDRLYTKPKPTNQIYFLNEEPYVGIDNCYFGGTRLMYILANEFHRNLDSIIAEYPKNWYTEYLVYFKALKINLDMWNFLITRTHNVQDLSII